MKRRHWQYMAIWMLWGLSGSSALGLGANLYGTLVVTPPECTLNNNNQTPVHFGDILLTRIDGNNYVQPVPLTLLCDSLAKPNLTFTLEGDPTSFNSNGALKTSNNKLGIVFYVNNVRQPINQPVNVNYTTLPSIKAAPVKNGAASFAGSDGGTFTALATLKVSYQ